MRRYTDRLRDGEGDPIERTRPSPMLRRRPPARPARPGPRTDRTAAGRARASRLRFGAEVDRCGRVHDTGLDQEIDEPRYERQPVEVAEVDPPGFGGVVACDRRLS